MSELNEPVVQVKIGRLNRTFKILLKAEAELGEGVSRGNDCENTFGRATYTAQPLTECLLGLRDSEVQADSETTDINANLQRGSGHDAPEQTFA